MTGQRFHYSPLPPLPPAEQAPLLEVRNLSRGEKYRNVNLALRSGEIVSIVGLLGAGRTELCLSLFGMTRPDSGEIRIEGQRCSCTTTAKRCATASAMCRRIA